MIPKIIHFCYGFDKNFGGKPFSIFHYIAIRSAFEVNKPVEIFLYYKYEPEGVWWEKAKKFAVTEKVEPPETIKGKTLNHYAHKSDVMRLQILKEKGGIYLDMDTVCKKPFDILLDNKFVIGKDKDTAARACSLMQATNILSIILYEYCKNIEIIGGKHILIINLFIG